MNNVQESDMGTYLCTATNIAGADECSAFLSVRGQYLYVVRGHKLIFKKTSVFPLLHISDYYSLHQKFKCAFSLFYLHA